MSLTNRPLAAVALAAALGGISLSAGAAERAAIPASDLAHLDPLSEVVVLGDNQSDAPRTIVVRIDDKPGAAYADRVNAERIVPPGPFTVRFRVALMATPSGRALEMGRLAAANAWAPGGGVDFTGMGIELPAALPTDVRGWYFGPAAAAPLRGFEEVTPADPRVSGPGVRRIRRPGTDPLLTWGTRLTLFETRLESGRYRITMWTEDPGEWETLPPIIERRIRVNGADLLHYRRDHDWWVRSRYLSGRDREADPNAAPYESISGRRGARVEGEVEVFGGRLRIEMAGHPGAATHIVAVTAEPVGQNPPQAAALVEEARAARFADDWHVLAEPQTFPPPSQLNLAPASPTRVVIAPGGVGVVRLEARSPLAASGAAEIAWSGEVGAGAEGSLYWGMWRWRRNSVGSHGLLFSSDHLRGDVGRIPLRSDLPRPIVAVIRIAEDAKPGVRRGVISVTGGGNSAELPIEVVVPDIRIAPPRQRVGAFLDFAPHLLSDRSTAPMARRQAACDMDTLTSFGLRAGVPPLAQPDEPGRDQFLADLREASIRHSGPIMAYAPVRQMAVRLGPEVAADMAGRTDRSIAALGLPRVAWSIADEPGAEGGAAVERLSREMRRLAPGALVAGHLNSPSDVALLRHFDLVTINEGYGASAARIDEIRRAGVQPWLYNMPRLRAGSGAFLWRSGADGLIQWHARMPTADAFDPTDGREGDAQFLWPTPEVCGSPDIDASLLALAEGAEDLRWLSWLESEAARGRPEARALLARARATVPADWAGMDSLSDEAIILLRESIIKLTGTTNP